MKRTQLTKRNLGGVVLLLAVIAALFIAASSSAKPTTIRLGNLIVSADAIATPSVLPSHRYVPVNLKISGSIKTADGTHVPPLKTAELEFDRNGIIDTKGLPTCRLTQITNTLTAQAKKVCGSALVGSGKVGAEVQFSPDSPKVPANGQLLIFNGKPEGGNPVFLLHSFVRSPVATTVIAKAVVDSPKSGPWGLHTVITVPPLSGGYGSFVSVNAKLGKTWTYKGKKHGLLPTKCSNGHLRAHGDFTFVDGTELIGDFIQPCRAKG